MSIIDIIKSYEDYIGSNGRTETEINKAEKELNLLFADDYKEYLSEIGIATFDGRELTGIWKGHYQDVVAMTKEKKEIHAEIPDDFYVVEDLGIDGILIWQSSKGSVYQTLPNQRPHKIADSLAEYLER